MRVLSIEKFFPPRGGIGSYIRCVSDQLTRRGHDVLQFGTVDTPDPDMPRYLDFTATRDPRLIVPMVYNREVANKLEQFLKRNPVDVAHLHTIYHHLTPSILPVLARHGVGVVMTLHDYRLACPTKHFLRPSGHCMRCHPNRFWHAISPKCAGLGGVALAVESFVHRMTRSYFRHVDFFICPTRFMRKTMLETGLPRSKTVVLRNPVPLMPNVGEEAIAGDELLFAGRLSPEKAPEMMLDLAERLPDAKVVIAGDGPMLEDLKQDVQRRQLANVKLTGHLEHKDLARYVARAAAVVVTSRWLENSTMTMLEAMRMGRCVIVPDRGPLKEWVTDGVTGRLFVPECIESLVDVTRQVLCDSGQSVRMGQAASELVRSMHDPATVTDQLETVYRAAIDRNALRV